MEKADVQPQSVQADSLTKSNKLMNAMELQQLCSCGRGERVMFVCVKTSCPNHTKQPLYCIECSDDEPSAHDHKVKPITFQT